MGGGGFKEGIEVKNTSGMNVFVIVAPYLNATTTVCMHGAIALSGEGAGLGAAVHKVFRPRKDPVQKAWVQAGDSEKFNTSSDFTYLSVLSQENGPPMGQVDRQVDCGFKLTLST